METRSPKKGEREFQQMMLRSAAFKAMQKDVDKVQKDVADVSTSVANLETGQRTGFGKMEALLHCMMPGKKVPGSPTTDARPPKPMNAGPEGAGHTIPTLPTVHMDETVDPATHDKLVKLLDLKAGNQYVTRSRPLAEQPVSFARWLGKALPSKRAQTWIETVRALEPLKAIIGQKTLDEADNLDDVYEMLTANSMAVLSMVKDM